MPIKLEKDTQKYLVGSIKRFFAEDMGDEIGDLKAMRVLDFCIKRLGRASTIRRSRMPNHIFRRRRQIWAVHAMRPSLTSGRNS